MSTTTLGWFDKFWNINLPLRAFNRRGWSLAIFHHEYTHLVLQHSSPYGIAELAIGYLQIALYALKQNRLTVILGKLASEMHSGSIRTQEGVATAAGLEYAERFGSAALSQDMLDELDEFYREAWAVIDSAVCTLQVPFGERGRIAMYLGLLASGSAILEDWAGDDLTLADIRSSITYHSPDSRLERMIRVLPDLPAGIADRWIQNYRGGVRPAIPDTIQQAVDCRFVEYQNQWPVLRQTVRRVGSALQREFSGNPDAANACDRAVEIVDSVIEQFSKFPADPTWKVAIVPDRIGRVERHNEDAPDEVWQAAEIVLVAANKLAFPMPRGIARSPLEQTGEIPAHAAEVTLFTSSAGVHRFTTNNRTRLLGRLAMLKPDQHIFMSAESSLQNVFETLLERAKARGLLAKDQRADALHLAQRLHMEPEVLAEGWLPPNHLLSMVHVGCFSELFRSLSPFLNPASPLSCLVFPSKAAERYRSDSQLRDLDIGAYGYAIVKFQIEGFPLLFWPTAVFVAETILGDRSLMRRVGIRIVENPDDELVKVFGSPDAIAAFEALRNHFEYGPS
jgi:hypothetical protein